MKIFFSTLSFFFVFGITAQSQNISKIPFALGVIDQVRSVELGETRTLNVYLPQGYNDTFAKYPVIYLLDGSADEDFIHIAGLVQFLNMIAKMPKSIVVGVANVDRKRDFTFPTQNNVDLKAMPTTGKSQKFINFIEKDLQPYVRQKYRTTLQRTIIGQSLGGLLAAEILLKKPELFDHYIIISPSLWWDDESLLKAAPELLRSHSYVGKKVYLSVGSEGKQMEADVLKFDQLLRLAGIKPLFNPMPEENHLTILHNSVYKAFELLD